MADKEFKTRYAKNTSHLEIYLEGGGEIPAKLRGLFNKQSAADIAIHIYITERDAVHPKQKPGRKKPTGRVYTGAPIRGVR